MWLEFVTIVELRTLVDVVLLVLQTVAEALVAATLTLVLDDSNLREFGQLPAKRSHPLSHS